MPWSCLPATEVFCFGTRLTRAAAPLRPRRSRRRHGTALADILTDWDSGTRIGDSLAAFLERSHHATLVRGAVVRSSPTGSSAAIRANGPGDGPARAPGASPDLGEPMLADPRYQPQTRAMQAVRSIEPDGGRASIAAWMGFPRPSPRRRPPARLGRDAVSFEFGMTGIIDAHHHIWRQADLPWLSGPMLPRIFGPYESIRRDYPPEGHLGRQRRMASPAASSGQLGTGAGRQGARVQGEHRAHGLADGAGCLCRPRGPDVAAELRALAAIPTVRGIRQQLHWHEDAALPLRRPARPR